MTSRQHLRRRYVAALLSCPVLVGLSIVWIDRPAALWSHDVLHRARAFVWLTLIVEPIAGIAILGAALAGIAAIVGWRPGLRGRTLVACCVAAIVSVTTCRELKLAFGRTWPETWVASNPSWVQNGVFEFHPFHGGQGWASFPSGHMAVITALVGVLWVGFPHFRWLWATLVAAVAIGLFGADFHFVGDIIGGTYLGAACAAGTLALVGYEAPQYGRQPAAFGAGDANGAATSGGRVQASARTLT